MRDGATTGCLPWPCQVSEARPWAGEHHRLFPAQPHSWQKRGLPLESDMHTQEMRKRHLLLSYKLEADGWAWRNQAVTF